MRIINAIGCFVRTSQITLTESFRFQNRRQIAHIIPRNHIRLFAGVAHFKLVCVIITPVIKVLYESQFKVTLR